MGPEPGVRLPRRLLRGRLRLRVLLQRGRRQELGLARHRRRQHGSCGRVISSYLLSIYVLKRPVCLFIRLF